MAKRACDGDDVAAPVGFPALAPAAGSGPSSKKARRENSVPELNNAYMNTEGKLFKDMKNAWRYVITWVGGDYIINDLGAKPPAQPGRSY